MTKLSPVLAGLGLGVVFVLFSLAVYFFLKLPTLNSSPITQRVGLGLGMFAIGLYFIFSLFIPAKIEESKEYLQLLYK